MGSSALDTCQHHGQSKEEKRWWWPINHVTLYKRKEWEPGLNLITYRDPVEAQLMIGFFYWTSNFVRDVKMDWV